MKLSPSIFWMIGGIFILIGVGLWAFQRYGPTPIPQPLDPVDDPFVTEKAQMPDSVPALEPYTIGSIDEEPDTIVQEGRIQRDDIQRMIDSLRAEVTSTPDPFDYDGMLMKDQRTTKMIFHLPRGGYGVPEFDVYEWTPGIFDTGVFDVGSGTAVAYEDEDGRLVLLAHSGKNQTMTPIQNYLELGEHGNRQPPVIAEMRITNFLIGAADVYISQGEDFQYSRVAAGVRVPPSDVEEVSLHIMDLSRHLGERYPDSGFAELGSDALILYFCGRALAGEDVNPRLNHWTQARFVLGLVPLEVVDETFNSGQNRD